MKQNFYMGTYHDKEQIFKTIEDCDLTTPCLSTEGSSVHIPVVNITNLRPVTVLDIASEKLLEWVSKSAPLRIYAMKDNEFDAFIDIKEGIIAQLSTPAEPATSSGMKSPAHQTTEITTTSVGKKGCCICDDGCKGFADGHELHHFCSDHGKLANPWMRINCSNSAPQSPKGVTIDGVSAEEIVRLIKVAWVSIVRSHYETGSLEMVGIAKAILDQISSNKHDEICAFPRRVCTCINQLTPTPPPKNEIGKVCVTEPLGSGAVVEADYRSVRGTGNLVGSSKWVRVYNSWKDDRGYSVRWEYLINPILLSEGVEK